MWINTKPYPHATFSYCVIYETFTMLNTKPMVLYGVTPCSLVDRHERFRINRGRRTSQGKVLHLRVLQWAGSRATSGKNNGKCYI